MGEGGGSTGGGVGGCPLTSSAQHRTPCSAPSELQVGSMPYSPARRPAPSPAPHDSHDHTGAASSPQPVPRAMRSSDNAQSRTPCSAQRADASAQVAARRQPPRPMAEWAHTPMDASLLHSRSSGMLQERAERMGETGGGAGGGGSSGGGGIGRGGGTTGGGDGGSPLTSSAQHRTPCSALAELQVGCTPNSPAWPAATPSPTLHASHDHTNAASSPQPVPRAMRSSANEQSRTPYSVQRAAASAQVAESKQPPMPMAEWAQTLNEASWCHPASSTELQVRPEGSGETTDMSR